MGRIEDILKCHHMDLLLGLPVEEGEESLPALRNIDRFGTRSLAWTMEFVSFQNYRPGRETYEISGLDKCVFGIS